MIGGKTNTGFEFTFYDEAMDDLELFDDIAGLDSGNIRSLKSIIVRIIGEDGQKALYEHCRGENGRVSIVGVEQELKAIFDAVSEKSKAVKN